jgi:hypothetical protein
MKWSAVPPEHLKVALAALEPQLRREHQVRLAQIRGELQRRSEELHAQEVAARRAHVLFLVGLVAGFVLSAGMLAGAIIVGDHGHVGLASILCGPSVVALASVFVLRRTDTARSQDLAHAQHDAIGASDVG